jgi:hypothetical protein
MYRTGGHGTLDLWFNVKLSPPEWFNIKPLTSRWFNVKPLPRFGLILNYLSKMHQKRKDVNLGQLPANLLILYNKTPPPKI